MKRILSLLLTLAMLLTSVPVIALSESEPEATAVQQTEAPQETAAPEVTPTEAVTAQPEAEATEETPSVTEQPTDEPTAAPAQEEPTATPAQEEPTVETAAILEVSDANLVFSTLVYGYETASPLTFTLRNTGDGDADLLYSSLTAFTVNGAARLAAGDSATVSVTPVTGLAAGDYSETLTIAAGDCSVSVQISVTVAAYEGDALMLGVIITTSSYDPLPAPTNFTATAADYNAVQLAWDEVTGATKYRLYYSTAQSGNYTMLADVVAGTTSYLAKGSAIVCGTLYYFKICAYSADTEPGTISDPKSAKPLPVAPSDLSAVPLSMSSNRITWTANTTGTSGYIIYVSTEEDVLSFTYLATITSRTTTRYDHLGLTPGTTYYYRIKAYYTVNSVDQLGLLSTTSVSATPTLPTITGFTATAISSTSVRLKWSRQSSVTGYLITRRLVSGGNIYATYNIPSNTTVTMDDTGLSVGTTYYYTIQAYYTGTSTVYGPDTNVTGKPLPMAPSTISAVSAAYDKITVTWGSVLDANGYVVYRRAVDSGAEFTEAGKTEGTSFTDDNGGLGLVTGDAYEYKVSSYCISGDYTYEGAISGKSALARPKPEQVQDVEVLADTFSSLTVTWTASDGAEEYIVECSTVSSFTTTTTVSATTDKTQYTFAGLTCGRLYYFRVTSTVTGSDGELTKGKVSSVVSQRPLPATPTDLSASYTSSSNIRLTWSPASDGANGYYIYRSTVADSGYAVVGKVSSKSLLYYVDSGLTTAQLYYYKICPYVTYSYVNFTGTLTDYVSMMALPGKPVISAVTSAGSTSLKVTWGAVSGATGYYLSYATAEGGPWETVTITSGSTITYTLKDLVETGRTTYVKVQAYTLYNGVIEVGVESEIASGSALPGQVTGIAVTPGDDNSMTITWTTLQTTGNVADGYYVYRCTKGGVIKGGPFDVKDGTIGTYTDTGLDVGSYYYYYVTAYAAGYDTSWVEGPASVISGALITPNIPKNFALTQDSYNSIMLTWEVATSADGYEIYYSTNNSSYYLLTSINDGASTSYVHLNLIPGRKYYYKMRAFYHPTETSYLYSVYTATLYLATKPLPPTDVAVTVDTTTGYPKLTWTKAEGATGYLVYYDIDPDGAFSSYRTVTTNVDNYTISGLTVGRKYYFKVKSRVVYNYTVVPSDDYSNMDSNTVAPARPGAPTATAVNHNTVRLAWKAVSGAVGYYVYVRTDTDGADYTMRYQVTGTTVKVIADDLISCRYMNYTVSAYCYEYDTTTELEGIESATTRYLVRLSAPSYLTANVTDTNTVVLSWNAVTGAAGYRVSRKLPGETTYSELALLRTPDTRSYTDSTLATVVSVGEVVNYIVEAWIEDDEGGRFGASSYARSICRLPPTPENLTADVAAGYTGIYRSIDLAWDAITWDVAPGVSYGFQLQGSVNGGSYLTLWMKYTATSAYTHTPLRTGSTYSYRLRTYIKIGTKVFYSPFSNVASAKPELDKIDDMTAVTAGKGKVRLDWTGVSGTSGIYIYRRAGTTSAFTRLPALKAGTITYLDTGRASGVLYQYRIMPYVIYSGKIVAGPISDIVEVTTE